MTGRDADPEAALSDLFERVENLEHGGIPTDHMSTPFAMSPHIDEIAKALAEARAEFAAVIKTKTAKIKGKSKAGNDFEMKYNYADLGDVLAACTPALSKHGIAVVQAPIRDSKGVTIVTMLLHSSGQWIRSNLWMNAGDGKPQAVGSAVTYGRRYALAPMVGVASEDDDDGNHAHQTSEPNHGPPPRETQRRTNVTSHGQTGGTTAGSVVGHSPDFPEVSDAEGRVRSARTALNAIVEHKGKAMSAKGLEWAPVPLISAALGEKWPGREGATLEHYQRAITGLKSMDAAELGVEIAAYMPAPYGGDMDDGTAEQDSQKSIGSMGQEMIDNAKGDS